MLTLSRPLGAGKVAEYFGHADPILNTPGTWQGKGAEHLGLVGEVQGAQFKAVLEGVNPQSGEQLRGHAKGGHDRAAVDLVLSAPKSLSIAAVNDQTLIVAHQDSVAAAINHLESYAQARQQIDGVRGTITTGNLAIAQFDHFLSRSLDPQLHSHLVIMNLTLLDDGRWRALDNNPLYRHQLQIGQMYRTELGQQLHEMGLQITVTDSAQNLFELNGVPAELISLFSSRRGDLSNPALLENLRESYPAASEARIHELATYITRPDKKTNLSRDSIIQGWQGRALTRGYNLYHLQLDRTHAKELAGEHSPTAALQAQREKTAAEHCQEIHAPSENALANFLAGQDSGTKAMEPEFKEYSR